MTRTSTITRSLAGATLVPVLALGLSACGSSDGAATTAASASSSTSMSAMPMPSTSTTAEPSGSSTTASAAPVISITDFTFTVPASVAPGATVTIKNADSQAHTVTSRTGGFDVKVDPNGTATLTAPAKVGTYPFVCSFHAGMTGALVVR